MISIHKLLGMCLFCSVVGVGFDPLTRVKLFDIYSCWDFCTLEYSTQIQSVLIIDIGIGLSLIVCVNFSFSCCGMGSRETIGDK